MDTDNFRRIKRKKSRDERSGDLGHPIGSLRPIHPTSFALTIEMRWFSILMKAKSMSYCEDITSPYGSDTSTTGDIFRSSIPLSGTGLKTSRTTWLFLRWLVAEHQLRRKHYSTLRPPLPPGKSRYPLYRRLGGPRSRSG